MTPRYIIIHHSATEDSGTVSWGAIRKWHTGQHPQSPYKWADVGYHYCIELIDKEYEVLIGRPEDVAGAHCQGMNFNSIGICFIGNFDEKPPPDAMMKRAVAVFAPIIRRLNIDYELVKPHSTYALKTCPGKMFPMGRFIKALVRGNW